MLSSAPVLPGSQVQNAAEKAPSTVVFLPVEHCVQA